MKAAVIICSLGMSFEATRLFYSFINNETGDVLFFSGCFMAQFGFLLFAIRKLS